MNVVGVCGKVELVKEVVVEKLDSVAHLRMEGGFSVRAGVGEEAPTVDVFLVRVYQLLQELILL